MGPLCHLWNLDLGTLPVSNVPSPEGVESWNQDKGVWESFDGKERWAVLMSVFDGRDRDDVMEQVKKVVGDTPVEDLLVAVRDAAFETPETCSVAVGLARRKGGFSEQEFSQKPLEEAVFSGWT